MSRALRGALALGAALVSCVPFGALLPACTTTANVSDAYMALDGQGLRKRTRFFTDSKEIHCVAEMGIGRDGVTVEGIIRQLVFWDFATQKLVDTNRVVAYAETSPSRADGPQKFDLTLEKLDPATGEAGNDDTPFPYGRYQCEISLDGELMRTAVFNIEFPDCPASELKSTGICQGFYKKGQTCPRYGATSTDPAQCTCDDVKGWDCQGQ